MANPAEAMTMAGQAVVMFDTIQKDSSLWEGLLGLPSLLVPSSVDQALDEAQALLTNIQRYCTGTGRGWFLETRSSQ